MSVKCIFLLRYVCGPTVSEPVEAWVSEVCLWHLKARCSLVVMLRGVGGIVCGPYYGPKLSSHCLIKSIVFSEICCKVC